MPEKTTLSSSQACHGKSAHNSSTRRLAMNRKLNTARSQTDQSYITNDRPAILEGRRMTPFELPPDFDLTYHKKILASGEIQEATPEDYAKQIARLKQQIKDSLG
jgi:hypothetical protein